MIYTFYSYKGGVGRSMALANLAHWFYLKGLRVVIVDWDLEAPGLENFFYEAPKEIEKVRSRLGLIDLLAAYKREYPYLSRVEETAATTAATGGTATKEGDSAIPLARDLDDAAFLKRLQTLPPLADTWIQMKPEPNVSDSPTPSDKRVLRLISAGWRAGDRFSDYAREVQNFNWSDFYQSYRGKVYFEWFRNQLVSDNDVVLIDSRTGVTEMSGVCTQDLADVVVSLCVPNVQNLTGVAQMSRAFVRDELKAARQPRTLPAIAIVPTRIENSESDLRARFKDEFFITLRELKGTDQSRSIDPELAWRMRIPYIPKYAYAEKLAIGAEDGNEDLIESYNRVGAYLLTLAFSDEQWVARTDRSLQERLRVIVDPTQANMRARSGAYLSYSQRDGKEFAERLVQLLQQQDVDVSRLPSGKDSPAEVSSAISQSESMLLVVTRGALESEFIRAEWRHARQQGVCVYAVKGSSDLDSTALPRWLRRVQLYDIGLGEGIGKGDWKRLTKELRVPCRAPRVPFTVDKLPDGFVARQAELEQVAASLVDARSQEPIPGVVALRGPGGCGKSVIAAAACHDARVQDAFDDGIVWIALGQSPGDLKARVEDLLHLLGGEPNRSGTIETAGYQLSELLSDRRMLIVIDDVWSPAHLRPFLQGGSNCSRLITTRNFDVVPSGARTISLGTMNQSEAVAVLSSGLPAGKQESLDALIERVGESPLALNMLNRALRHRVYETNQTVDDALSYVSNALDKRGPSFFDSRDDADQNTISKALGASLDLLSDGERARFMELAVFPPAADIPSATVAKLWKQTGQLDEFDADELCSRFNRLSLLDTFDAGKHQIRLHRLMREYVLEIQRESVSELHRRLLEAHRPPTDSVSRAGFTTNEDGWAALPDEEPYLWDHLAFHLVGAGLASELVSTVLSLPYLAVKTRLRGTAAVEKDLLAAEKHRPDDPVLIPLRRRFIQVAHILSRCNGLSEIAATLFCRLSDLEELDLITLYLEARLPVPYLAPRHLLPDVPAPNLFRVLVGHSQRVNGCAFGPDGKVVVSASDDNTVKIWDTETGVEIVSLIHSDGVNACAVSPDGSFIVSASSGGTLGVWDVASRMGQPPLMAHQGFSVLDCAIFPDGLKIVSASADGSLKIWDVESGEELRALVGHEKPVNACAVSADGALILSSSDDGTLKVWDSSTAELLLSTEPQRGSVNDCAIDPTATLLISASSNSTLKTWWLEGKQRIAIQQVTLRGHSGRVNCCEIASDGSFIVSGGIDHMVKVWDAKVGRERSTLRGHTAWVNDCAISCDDKTVVSASNDRSLRIWNSTVASDPGVFSKHTLWTRSVAISADGSRLVTGSDDNNVRVWNTETGAEVSTLASHKGWVRDCAIGRDGSVIVSASSDGTLGIWDARTGSRKATLEFSGGLVNGCAITRDGLLIVSAHENGKLLVWDAKSGEFERAFEGHRGEVNRCAIDPESRYVLSASSDKTLKVWKLSTGKLLRSIDAHTGPVNDCDISEDGSFAVSASADNTLKIWDTGSWANLSTFLAGHTDTVTGCAIAPDGTMIASVSRDGTLRVWDARRADCLATFYSDGGLFGCVWFPDGKHIAAVGAAGGVYFVRFERESNSSPVEPLELNMSVKTPG